MGINLREGAMGNEKSRDTGNIGHNTYKEDKQAKNTTQEAKKYEQYESTKITGAT